MASPCQGEIGSVRDRHGALSISSMVEQLSDEQPTMVRFHYAQFKIKRKDSVTMESKIRKLIKDAMIEKNRNKQITYKSILEGAQKIAKQTNTTVTDDMLTKAIKNEMKQLNDMKQYCDEGSDRYVEVMEKLSYCEVILPAMVTEDVILAYLTTNNIEKNIGVCMKALKAEYGTSLDGKAAQVTVKSYIGA